MYARYRFMGCVIHHRQVLDAAPFSRAVKHEVHRPHLICRRWALQGMHVAQGSLFASALFHLKTRFSVEPVHALVVDDLSSLAQLQIDHFSAVSAMALGQDNDLLLEHAVAVLSWLIAVGTGTHVGDA